MTEVRAITFDLDNTLWDVFPALEKAEENAYALLQQKYPRIVERHTVLSIRDLREHLFETMSDIRHDFTELRRRVYLQLLEESGYPVEGAEYLLKRFLHDRNQLTLYPDVLPALTKLYEKYPLISLSDGNSDLEEVGIRHFFTGCVYAADVGHLKPHPAGFLKACEIADAKPAEILHVGDHPDYDVDGARKVGMQTMWIQRNGELWTRDFEPDYRVTSLDQAVDLFC